MSNESQRSFIVPQELDGRSLAGALHALAGLSWNDSRRHVRTGKIRVRGECIERPEHPVQAGAEIQILPNAPRPGNAGQLDRSALVYVDSQVAVVRKPAGLSTVPFVPGERGTLDQLVARLLHKLSHGRGPAPSVGVVQRLDKETTGLLVFAKTFSAKKILAHQLRLHTMERIYFALAHGHVRAQTLRGELVQDRGDGLRGVARRGERGQAAVTHVEPVRVLGGATLVRCRLETGRTHQIRIHLAESGHPLVGERIYVRDYAGAKLQAPRIMLHAGVLGFDHPATGQFLRFEEPVPADFAAVLAQLESGSAP